MAFSEKISLIVDVVTGNANSQLSSFKSKLAEAEGGFAKLKVAGSSAFSSLASSPATILAVGGAIAGFAAKGVSDFQNVALAAGKLSDATGLSTEAASRWIEVADHIGVSEGAVSSAFRRLDVAIGSNSKGWQDLGIQVAKNADGTTNLSDTFLRAVTALQAIEDPAKRAAAAQKLFGKGYAEVAELIGRSAPDLARMLNEVGDAKVITPEEVEKARAFRGAMDDLGDAVQEAGMEIGEDLVPTLITAALALAKVVDLAGNVKDAITAIPDPGAGNGIFGKLFRAAEDSINPLKSVVDTIGKLGESSKETGKSTEMVEDRLARYVPAAITMKDVTKDAADAAKEAAEKQRDLAAAIKESEDAATAAATAIEEMADAARASSDSTFALSEAQDKLTEFVNGYDQAVADAGGDQLKLNEIYRDGAKAALEVADSQVQLAEDTAKASGATLSGAQKIEIFNKSALAQAAQLKGPTQAALIDHIAQINKIPPEKVSEIKALLNAGQVAAAEAALNNASRTRNAALFASVLGISAAEAALQSLTRTRNAIINTYIVQHGGAGYGAAGVPRASGGTVVSGGLYAMGENGPELVSWDASGRGRVTPAGSTARMTGASSSGGGGDIHVHVAGSVVTEKGLVDAIHQGLIAKRRRSGDLGLAS